MKILSERLNKYSTYCFHAKESILGLIKSYIQTENALATEEVSVSGVDQLDIDGITNTSILISLMTKLRNIGLLDINDIENVYHLADQVGHHMLSIIKDATVLSIYEAKQEELTLEENQDAVIRTVNSSRSMQWLLVNKIALDKDTIEKYSKMVSVVGKVS